MQKNSYSPVHKCWPKTSCAGNQGNHQNFDPSLQPKKLTDFHGDEAKNITKWGRGAKAPSAPPLTNP